jgi:UDP-2-acetamido-3-amino-2,3-dideoxy-glucuronate N-acetyltransferase
MTEAQVAVTADVDPRAEIGIGSSIWHLAQIREGAVLGTNCIIGRGAYIGTDVRLGDNCKVQNYALIYEPAVLADGVFVGPAAVLTNDRYPRAVNPDGSLKTVHDWYPVGVTIGSGASIGARATCIGPVAIGRWAMVAAGAVVTRDVPDFAIVVGVPAKWVGWIGKAGVPLAASTDHGEWICPQTDARYFESDGVLREAGA